MSDVNISKFRAQVVRDGSKPATPGFVVSEGQSPTDPAGSGQNHLPVTIAAASTGLAITESQILGGAGTVSQYIRGDGSLADFPATTGGGSSVSYYLNGSVSQGTIGGVAYREVNRNPVFGAGTDIATSSNGYIANFITDAGDPNKLLIPAGNWNLETYFSANSGGGSPTFYVELYKYDGTTFTLIATSSGTPELIAFGTNINPYFTTLAVPETILTLTDRLALRYYVNTAGRTITLHTENGHLCQVITTFTTGLTALNGLTTQVQFFAVGTSGTDFAISSATDTHTFNLPTASGTNRGALSSGDWTTFNNKENAITAGTTAQYFRGDKTFQTLNTSVVPEGTNLYYTEARVNANTNVAANTAARHNAVTLGTANGLSLSTQVLSLGLASAGVTGALSGTDWSTFNSKQNALTLTTTGTSGAATLVGSTLNIPQYQAAGTYVTAVTASSPLASSGGTTPNITIQQASGSQNGFLSSTDWTTFNNKQNALTNPVTGTGTTNYLSKFTGTSTIGNSQVFDNGTNVGINRNNPTRTLDILGASGVGTVLKLEGASGTTTYLQLAYNGATNSQSGYIGYNSSSQMQFFTNDTLRATITSGGNVGIGTTAPISRLMVQDSLNSFSAHFSGNNQTNGVAIGTNGSNVAVIQGYTRTFSATNNIAMQVDGGNVGIGTSSPNSILELSSTSPVLRIQASSSADFHGLEFRQGAGLDATIKQLPVTGEFRISNGRSAGWGGFTTFYTDTTERARITSGGNLLVNTTTDAGFKLDVNGTGRFTQNLTIGAATAATNVKLIFNGVASKAAGIEFHQSGTPQWYIGNGIASEDNNFELYNSNGTMAMKIIKSTNAINFIGAATFSSSVTATELYLSTSSGLVGNINSSNANGGYLTWQTSGTTIADIGTAQQIFGSGGNAVFGINGRGARDIAFGTNNTERMRITSGGNVLIGTTTDVGAKLYVNGGIRTANPTGSTSNDWLLGRALISGTSSPDRWIRVQIGNLYYDILAVYMGSV
jgi:hypothetical protein